MIQSHAPAAEPYTHTPAPNYSVSEFRMQETNGDDDRAKQPRELYNIEIQI